AASVGFRNTADAYVIQPTARLGNNPPAPPAGTQLPIQGLTVAVPSGTLFTLSDSFGQIHSFTTTVDLTPDSVSVQFTPNLNTTNFTTLTANDRIAFNAIQLATASIDIVTNIVVQGLAKNLPHAPAGQVVQCPLEIERNPAAPGNVPIRLFHTSQPHSTRFRCQSLPDRIRLQVVRVPVLLNRTLASSLLTRTAPDFITMNMEVEFDE
ncbi:MAG TPA: hypothetical protein DCW74_21005, partial [Alteromonas australica]|nr:hypothetical protein [Alteromonas australica]